MSAPEATITSRGLYNPAPVIAKTIVDACDYAGYLVHVSATAGSFDCCDAVTDVPVGYTVKSTVPATMQSMVNWTNGTAQANQLIGVQALIPGQEAYLMMGPTLTTVPVGTYCGPSSSDGMLCPRTSAAACTYTAVIMCVTLEATGSVLTAATVGSVVKVRIISPMYLTTGEVPT